MPVPSTLGTEDVGQPALTTENTRLLPRRLCHLVGKKADSGRTKRGSGLYSDQDDCLYAAESSPLDRRLRGSTIRTSLTE
jgi:hypothetical protein